MKEIYYLNDNILPTIPVPHDCVIDSITSENQYIVFAFESDISHHDSIKNINPDAKSLVMKFHLVDECFDLYKWHKPVKIFANKGFFKCIDNSKLFGLTLSEYKLEYLYHYFGYQSLIIELCSDTIIRLELTVDYIEVYWS